MYPTPTQCPICHADLAVTRLACRTCGTTLEGQFALGRLFQLSPEQLQFVETFLRCEGKLNRVQEELGLSYPTVRNRLEVVVRALGFDVPAPPAMPVTGGDTREDVLQRLARHEITSEEALALLQEG
jgi:hypothetical protein